MLEALLVFAIYVALLVLVVWIVLWAIGQCGLNLPPQVGKIVWVVVVLIIVLWAVRTLLPMASSLSPR